MSVSESGSGSLTASGHHRPTSATASTNANAHANPVGTSAFMPDFGEIQLTLAEERELQQRAHLLVRETMAEYDDFVIKENRKVNTKVWKSVKSRESFTVYRDRRNAVDRAYASQSQVIRPDDFTMPPLLGVGGIVGAVEDIMYGLVAYGSTDMQWKSAQQQGDEMNGKMLVELQAPSIDDPFRYLGVRWSLMGHNSLTSVVLHDLVILVGTGMELLPNGDSVGFQLTHSIQLPECPELGEQNILRSRLSCCSLFHQQPHGNVAVYTKTYLEPSPNVPYSFALASTVSSMIDVVKVMEAGKDRKLARMLRDAKKRYTEGEKPVLAKDASGNNCCGLCRKCFRMYNTIVTCQLCYSMVCSRCHVSRQVSVADAEGNLAKKKAALCKNCVATIAKADATKIAAKDFVGNGNGINPRRSMEARSSLNEKVQQYLEGSTTTSAADLRMLQADQNIDNNMLLPYNHSSNSSYSDPMLEPAPMNMRALPSNVNVEDIDDVDESYRLPSSFDVKLPRQTQPNQRMYEQHYSTASSGHSSGEYTPSGGMLYDAPRPRSSGGKMAPRAQSQTYASNAAYAPPRDGYSHSDNYPSSRGYGSPQDAPMRGHPMQNGNGNYGVRSPYGEYAPSPAGPMPGAHRGAPSPQVRQPQYPPQGLPMNAPSPSQPQQFASHEEEIWMRMNRLRLAAEEAYNMARENGDAMQMGGGVPN